MRAQVVHVTDHALLRWRERLPGQGAMAQDLIGAVKASSVVKKPEPLPYPVPRRWGSVYSFHQQSKALFVLESVTIDEYRVVTVIAGCWQYSHPPPAGSRSSKRKYRDERRRRPP